jgi:hypothetical protein
MSMTMIVYALFVLWGAAALLALVMTDLSARRKTPRAVRVQQRPLLVIARADGRSTRAAPYRRASA